MLKKIPSTAVWRSVPKRTRLGRIRVGACSQFRRGLGVAWTRLRTMGGGDKWPDTGYIFKIKLLKSSHAFSVKERRESNVTPKRSA